MRIESVKALLLIACGGLLVAGAILLCLAVFGGGDRWTLPMALGCVALSGLFGLVHGQLTKKHDKGENT